mmetsp:Transcript_8259/g.17856  ORF Transcript_8259/g.17856 Transcript_8259/m.17856 type:complete len:125 (+) Transcript_8259:71-445(+)|eukprot:CAMPEP_0178574256 /NCGR_PEP_ID=MMETSP0697-20121206/19247_1 /TAXON_ID=265572 /ORGANISM="Extubocellulus spinifer, Strain CCMP396" /LENGTH=124 /DNA_ID=CAMNT_0020209215 /DNA_START=38 /DNA_END=412 /DNA_ORIENTATION=+
MKTSFAIVFALAIVAACSAFQPVARPSAYVVRSAASRIALNMAEEEVEDIATPDILPPASDGETKNVVKNIPTGETREVKWVDDAPTANESFAMSWGWIFLLGPLTLFLNDIFHIVPKGTWGLF